MLVVMQPNASAADRSWVVEELPGWHVGFEEPCDADVDIYEGALNILGS